MNDAPGPINFTMFLTLFGEKLQGTDPEDVIRNAFACFDEENTGCLHEEKLRELLSTMGERFSEEDVSYIFFFTLNYYAIFRLTCYHPSIFLVKISNAMSKITISHSLKVF